MEQNPLTNYINNLSEERQQVIQKLRKVILENLPSGFEEKVNTMIHYVVPFSIYPAGYHCPPKQPLPFLSLASQKHYVALYHMGIYSNPELLSWFVSEYPNHAKRKLDMGKSCIRFKSMDDIPYELIGQLISKMTVDQWIEIYEAQRNR
ncbi:MAG: DUF1801 domain-containing protein [Saprospiraceae bacterium]|nr:DUF1801 domain-containing protein [Saprospiraceae bacterium]